jgi:hypothetical protein
MTISSAKRVAAVLGIGGLTIADGGAGCIA